MTRIKNILVPVDFSDASKQALRYACELADTFEASLHVLHAAENLFVRSGYTEFYPLPQEFFDQIEQEARKQLETLLTRRSRPGTAPSSSIAQGCQLRKYWTTCEPRGTSISS